MIMKYYVIDAFADILLKEIQLVFVLWLYGCRMS